MRRVVFNQKGGVGKSSITCNLAAISAARGNRTLVVDLDPQGNSTHYLLGKPASALRDTVADLLEQTVAFTVFNRRPDEFVHASPFDNLFVLPSSPELDFLERKLEAKHKIYKLREALKKLGENFDEIYIDTAPALNFYTRSALIAAERCLIPFDCDDFSRQALYSLLNEIRDLQEDHNENLAVEGIIANQFQARASLPRQLVLELIEEGLPVLPVRLSSSVKMKESHQAGQPLIHFAPKHTLTQQYVDLFRHLQGETVQLAPLV
ncbi:ParA family protein [Marinobacter caseinilyticus]|uniref:ParA family protein n=1 Tax=Marinobacter caseinilyticus TaxID=2692195 RepID=UPI00140D44EC|nr:ParA family protein [Marinobacter caseinilyticus]